MSFIYKSPLTAQKGAAELLVTVTGAITSSTGASGFDTSGNYLKPTLEGSQVGSNDTVIISVTAIPNGGEPPYTYLWQSVSGIEFMDDNPITSGGSNITSASLFYSILESPRPYAWYGDDNWTITVTDSNNNTATASFDIIVYGNNEDFIYVAKNGIDYQTQSLSSHGMSDSPLLTINRAYSLAPNGSTIYVLSGSYAENVTLNKQVTLNTTETTASNYPLIASGNYFIYDMDWPAPTNRLLITGSQDRYYVKKFQTASFDRIIVTPSGSIENGLIECSNNAIVELQDGIYNVSNDYICAQSRSPGKIITLKGSPVTRINGVPTIPSIIYTNQVANPAGRSTMFQLTGSGANNETTLNIQDIKLQIDTSSFLSLNNRFVYFEYNSFSSQKNTTLLQNVYFSWLSGSYERPDLVGFLNSPASVTDAFNEISPLIYDRQDNVGITFNFITTRDDIQQKYLNFFNSAASLATSADGATVATAVSYVAGNLVNGGIASTRPIFRFQANTTWSLAGFGVKPGGYKIPSFYFDGVNDYVDGNHSNDFWNVTTLGFSGSKHIAFVFSPSSSTNGNQIYTKLGSEYSGFNCGMLPSSVGTNIFEVNVFSKPSGSGNPTKSMGEVATLTASLTPQHLYFVDMYFNGSNSGSNPILELAIYSGSNNGYYLVASQSYLQGTSSGYFSSSILHGMPTVVNTRITLGNIVGFTYFSGSIVGTTNVRSTYGSFKYAAYQIRSNQSYPTESIDIQMIRDRIANQYFLY